MATGAGLFEPACRMGQTVAAGGLVVVEWVNPLMEPGDLPFRLGEEIDPKPVIK